MVLLLYIHTQHFPRQSCISSTPYIPAQYIPWQSCISGTVPWDIHTHNILQPPDTKVIREYSALLKQFQNKDTRI